MLSRTLWKRIAIRRWCDAARGAKALTDSARVGLLMTTKAAAAWRRVARATGCSIVLVHHVRKGDATGIAMTSEDGENFGVNKEDCWQYVRLDDAKRNMAPAGKAKWFQLDQVSLGNYTPEYPNGDKVAAIVAWEPPTVWKATTPADLNAAIDTIRDGPTPGLLYTASRRGDSSRWAGQVLMDAFGVTEKQAKQMIGKWLNTGLLWEDTYKHPQWRREGLTRTRGHQHDPASAVVVNCQTYRP
jgi:hypothetical protein